MAYRIAGIDVHKRMLAVVLADVEVEGPYQFERRKVGTSPDQLRALAAWLVEREVEEVVIAYASHCTSFGRCETFSSAARLFDNLTPLAFSGGWGPGSSYRYSCLSLHR
jgi:hypothetical protein